MSRVAFRAARVLRARATPLRLARRLAPVLLLAAATGAAGCASRANGPVVTFPPQTFGAGSVSGATAATRDAIATALSADGLRIADPTTPYRPAEAAGLVDAPREVVQVLLPGDPDHGYISIYEFSDGAAAEAAARAQADYVGSPIGRVQFPPDSQFTIRVVGPTVVFHAYSPANSSDPGAARIPVDLATLGSGVDVPG